MSKQLSNCCKAGIRLTGKDRPQSFSCEKCGRIIGVPIDKTPEEQALKEKIKWFRRRLKAINTLFPKSPSAVEFEDLLQDYADQQAEKVKNKEAAFWKKDLLRVMDDDKKLIDQARKEARAALLQEIGSTVEGLGYWQNETGIYLNRDEVLALLSTLN